MNTVFKYMDFLGLEYFDEPTFRISLVEQLNDPFESNLSKTIEHIAKEYAKTISKKGLGKSEEILSRHAKSFISSALMGVGVISFSETHRNLLMWSHYSNDHKGICIEVETDWCKSKKRLSDTYSNVIHTFKRVQYDSRRVDFSEMNELNLSEFEIALIDICVKQLTLKSDEWMYEKEHRYILSFLEADYIKRIKYPFMNEDYRKTIEELAKEIGIVEGEKGYHTTNCTELDIFYKTYLSKAYMYLNKVPANKIKRIYLGHRFSVIDAQALINNIKQKDHPLNHVELYKCSISNERFELNTKKIY
ncbi:DUF2971 domain-containing protein [Aeromonas jandaei]|uniref:DUF2971 domain-containing protein n=1 Tax=Aeromonas jandaei TaxID=650 RepID=UPI003986A256